MATITQEIGGDDQSVGTSAALAFTASHRASASEPEKIVIQNVHASQTLTVGGSDVAAGSNGVVLGSQYDSVTLWLRVPGTQVYIVGSGASTTATVTRVG